MGLSCSVSISLTPAPLLVGSAIFFNVDESLSIACSLRGYMVFVTRRGSSSRLPLSMHATIAGGTPHLRNPHNNLWTYWHAPTDNSSPSRAFNQAICLPYLCGLRRLSASLCARHYLRRAICSPPVLSPFGCIFVFATKVSATALAS